MKRLVVVALCLVSMSACSNPEVAKQPLFSIRPNSLSFDSVRLGLSKDLAVQITNVSGDTLRDFHNGISEPTFHLLSLDTGALLPNGTRALSIRYTPTDTGLDHATDTLRIGNSSSTIGLQGRGTPFSHAFIAAPHVEIELTGVIGSTDSTHPFSFGFNVVPDDAHSDRNSYWLSERTYTIEAQSTSGAVRASSQTSTDLSIQFGGDLLIDSLIANYHYQYDAPGESYPKNELLKAHHLPLQLDGTSYVATIVGPAIGNIVDTLFYMCEGPSSRYSECVSPEWTGFVGYRSDAVLRIIIRE